MYVHFMTTQFDTMRTTVDATSFTNALEMVCSRERRENAVSVSFEASRCVQLGTVRGMAGIHFNAFMGNIPARAATLAGVSTDEGSGFYKGVKDLMYGGHDAEGDSTMLKDLNRVIMSINKTHHCRVEMSDRDQCSCSFAREFLGFQDDGRKPDLVFFDEACRIFTPMRRYYHSYRGVHAIKFLVGTKWHNLGEYLNLKHIWEPPL
jgi:hypothetical protein